MLACHGQRRRGHHGHARIIIAGRWPISHSASDGFAAARGRVGCDLYGFTTPLSALLRRTARHGHPASPAGVSTGWMSASAADRGSLRGALAAGLTLV